MWARDVELCLGLWLWISPFVLRHGEDARLWANDLVCGTLLVLLPLLSYGRRTRRAHLLELLVAAWLVGVGWAASAAASAAEGPAPAAAQNHVVVGLLIAMLAIVPSQASLPPEPWRAPPPAPGGRRGRAGSERA